MSVEASKCYICSSDSFVDDHHYDCQEGRLSPETVPLCRRCHRTYHDLGVEWFDDEYLDKAIEIENKRRQIVYDSLVNPVKPLQLMTREDIKRTDYYYKKHGIKRERHLVTNEERGKVYSVIKLPCDEPLCGWEWVSDHLHDLENWVPRIEIIGPNLQFSMDIDNTERLKDAIKVIRGIKRSQVNARS